MASDVIPGQIPVASVVQGRQAATINFQAGNGKSLPPAGNGPTAAKSAVSGNSAAAAASAAEAVQRSQRQRPADPQSIVNSLNKYLNDSGRADQFRVDPSGNRVIQQINPANGAVLGEFDIDEFPALARSIGASGLIIDSLA